MSYNETIWLILAILMCLEEILSVLAAISGHLVVIKENLEKLFK